MPAPFIADPDSRFVFANNAKVKNGGFSTSDSLDNPNDVDVWRVNLHRGETLTASTDTADDFNPDTILALFDHRGNLLAYNDDSGGTLESFLSYEITTTGNYFVAVSSYFNFPNEAFGGEPDDFPSGPTYPGFGGSTGDYDLNLLVS